MTIPPNASTAYLRKIIATVEEANALLCENLEHVAGQLIERTATVVEMRGLLAALIAENIALANAKVDRMGENKPGKLLALGFIAGAFAVWIGGMVL